MTYKQTHMRMIKQINLNDLTTKIHKKDKYKIQRKQKLKEVTQIIKEIDKLTRAMNNLVIALDKLTIAFKQTING